MAKGWVFKSCVWDLLYSVTHFWSLLSLTLSCPAALLVTLVAIVAIVASAPISDKLDIMNKDTIEQAHSLINKILQGIPTTHADWIKSKVSYFRTVTTTDTEGHTPLHSENQSISMEFSVIDSENLHFVPIIINIWLNAYSSLIFVYVFLHMCIGVWLW